jgi:hypothetical protein
MEIRATARDLSASAVNFAASFLLLHDHGTPGGHPALRV